MPPDAEVVTDRSPPGVRHLELDGPVDWPTVNWSGRRQATSFGVDPYCYPGTRPDGSYAVSDHEVWGLDGVDGGWVDRDTGDRIDLADRALVLAYGSNADPAKLSARLTGTVFALRCLVRDHAAVWCNGRRRGDGAVVATIESDPGRIEQHHVLAVTLEQLVEMDRWEGHPDRYRRDRFGGPVLLESGAAPDEVWVYVGTEACRQALRIDGRSLRVAEHGHADVDHLVAR
jgi:hypothetical protein